jgi:hypothetical protein
MMVSTPSTLIAPDFAGSGGPLVKEVVGKHILRSDLESEARSTGEFEQEASHNVCQISALGLGLGGAEVHEEGEDEEEAVSGATTLHDPHSD